MVIGCSLLNFTLRNVVVSRGEVLACLQVLCNFAISILSLLSGENTSNGSAFGGDAIHKPNKNNSSSKTRMRQTGL